MGYVLSFSILLPIPISHPISNATASSRTKTWREPEDEITRRIWDDSRGEITREGNCGRGIRADL